MWHDMIRFRWKRLPLAATRKIHGGPAGGPWGAGRAGSGFRDWGCVSGRQLGSKRGIWTNSGGGAPRTHSLNVEIGRGPPGLGVHWG